MRSVIPAIVVGTLLGACSERPLGPTHPCTRSDTGRLGVVAPQSLDLLLVIDSSSSMADEQRALIAELPRLLGTLAEGDLDGDGGLELVPFWSIQVGVITTDLGTGSSTVATCRAGLGDDARLRDRSRGDPPCESIYPRAFFDVRSGASDDESVLTAIGCVAEVGTAGCGFEQPLEAALKALAPTAPRVWTAADYDVPRFLGADGVPDSVAGQGDGPNMGFLRPGSMLAVLVLTDEDDCSVRDDGLFDPADPRFADVPLDLRCARAAEDATVVQPIERYVRGLSGLRIDPSRLVLGAIVGVPPSSGPIDDLDAALADARSRRREDEARERLVPSCTGPRGDAFAPVRLLEVAQGLERLGAEISVSSICAASFAPAIDAFAAALARTQPIGCLPAPLPSRADGLVECSIYELQAQGTPCEPRRGRSQREVVEDEDGGTRALCLVTQVQPGSSEPGWYYDPETELCGGGHRVAFVDGAEPRATVDLRLVCANAIAATDSGAACGP